MQDVLKYEDIYFVSICHDDNKESWKKMFERKNLGGIQLFAPKNDKSFFEKYLVNGIPRFVLLDKMELL